MGREKNRTIKKIDRWVFTVRVTLRRGGVKRERQERQLDVSVYQLRLSEPLTHPERAVYFSEEPRDRERRSAPWSFCSFKRVISSRSVRESVLFLFIYRSVVSASRLPESTVHMFP